MSEKSFQGVIDKESIEEVLKLLSTKKLSDIQLNPNITKQTKRLFDNVKGFDIVHSEILSDNIHKFIAKKANNYVSILIHVYKKNADSDLEIFTQDLYRIQDNKNNYLNQAMKFDLVNPIPTDIQLKLYKDNEKVIEKYRIEETKIKAHQKVVLNKFQKSLETLLKEKMNKIIENKKLYSNLKKLSQEFYKSKESEDTKEEYQKSYKEHLETIEKNKKDIIELNNNINILQTKLTLYTSEVYIIYPYSSLEIINLSLDEAKKYEELSKSSMKEVAATPAKRVIVSKKGGHLYDLEYLEIPETFTESVESNFAKIKKEIKKKSKKFNKIEILSKYDLN